MRVLHLSTTLRGGAGIAATRLNQSLQSIGIESHVHCLTAEKEYTNTSIEVIHRSFADEFRSKSLTYIQSKVFSRSNTPLSSLSIESIDYKEIEKFDPDIINVHSMYNLLNHNSLLRLSNLGYPLVLTLHDQRPFTGGCHYSGGCDAFLKSCKECPQATSVGMHLVESVHRAQYTALEKISNLTVVSPSHWLAARSKESKILGKFPTLVINNPIPNANYSNIDLSQSNKIGFIASDLNNPLKNLSSLLLALQKMDSSAKDLEIVLIGKGEIQTKFENIKIVKLQSLEQSQIAEVISTLHLLVVPSLEDNSPNVIGEALISGTQVIGANIGGIPELLDYDKKFLFDPLDIDEISRTISRNLVKYDRKDVKNCAEKRFSFNVIAKKYVELYKSVI
jgi:glycosyltransferase involved in cell wall biosynthesis